MDNRRRVNRREPIIIETEIGDFEAKPLPWQQRNDLGDLVIQTYVAAVSAMVGAISMDEDGSVKGGTFDDKAIDWVGLLKLGFPSVDAKKFFELDIFEMRAIVSASLEVNGLEHLAYMIDPNSRSPENLTAEEVSDGAKTTSTPDSGSLGTAE